MIKVPSLFKNAVLWMAGDKDSTDGFPIIPSGVTVTPSSAFSVGSAGWNPIILFDGTKYLELTDDAAWALGSGDFTIAGMISTNSRNIQRVWYQHDVPGNHVSITLSIDGGIEFYVANAGTVIANYTTATEQYPVTTPFHLAVVRSGTSAGCIHFYVDGVEVSKTTTVDLAGSAMPDSALTLKLGGESAYNMYGYIKDLVLLKGTALSPVELKQMNILSHPITGPGVIPGITPAGVVYDYYRVIS